MLLRDIRLLRPLPGLHELALLIRVIHRLLRVRDPLWLGLRGGLVAERVPPGTVDALDEQDAMGRVSS